MSFTTRSFTRLRADKCAYDLEVRQSTTPLEYQLYSGQTQNCNSCHSQLNQQRSPYAIKDMVGIESQLFRLDVPVTRCPTEKAQLYNIKADNGFRDARNVCDGYDEFNEQTLLTDPKENYRGLSINRIYDPGLLPRGTRHYGWFGRNTQLEVRDTFHPQKIEPIHMCNDLPSSPTYQVSGCACST
jgi:hypothetical protein